MASHELACNVISWRVCIGVRMAGVAVVVGNFVWRGEKASPPEASPSPSEGGENRRMEDFEL